MVVFRGTILQLLARTNQTVSMSEGRRVVIQGAVKVNGVIIDDFTRIIDFDSSDQIQIGKRNPISVDDIQNKANKQWSPGLICD